VSQGSFDLTFQRVDRLDEWVDAGLVVVPKGACPYVKERAFKGSSGCVCVEGGVYCPANVCLDEAVFVGCPVFVRRKKREASV
jgi:hypothetical protein